jgi:hypothetical protein
MCFPTAGTAEEETLGPWLNAATGDAAKASEYLRVVVEVYQRL